VVVVVVVVVVIVVVKSLCVGGSGGPRGTMRAFGFELACNHVCDATRRSGRQVLGVGGRRHAGCVHRLPRGQVF